MGHKGRYTKSPQWWKHLRNYYKRMFNKTERKRAKFEIRRDNE